MRLFDPIKVSVITPGIQSDGLQRDWGIPAKIVTAYLDGEGIQVEKTTDYRSCSYSPSELPRASGET